MTYPLFIIMALAIQTLAIVALSIKVVRMSHRAEIANRKAAEAYVLAWDTNNLAKRSPFHASYQTKL